MHTKDKAKQPFSNKSWNWNTF